MTNKRMLSISAILHVVAIVYLIVTHGSTEPMPREYPPAPVQTELILEPLAPAAMPNALEPEAVPDASLTPVVYTGAPAESKPAASDADESEEPAPATESFNEDARPIEQDDQSAEAVQTVESEPHDDQPAADTPVTEGLEAPAFDITLGRDEVDRLLTTGQAALILRSGGTTYRVHGSLDNPQRVDVTDGRIHERFSSRAVALSPSVVEPALDAASVQYGWDAGNRRSVAVRMLLSHQVDALVLAAQKKATRDLPPKAVGRCVTRGRLTWAGDAVAAFNVQNVVTGE